MSKNNKSSKKGQKKGPKNGQYSLTDSLKALHADMVKRGFPPDYKFK